MKARYRWLQYAIVDGRIEDGTFRLRGDLAKFPFPAAADGEFRVAARLRDGVLDVSPQVDANGNRAPTPVWPLIRAIDADLLFERQGMTIRAQERLINGARISEATARIPDLGHDATLNVSGQVTGALGDMLGYVNASPVAGWIADITRGAEARGNARVDLKLDIPLLHAADTRVSGTLLLQNNDLTLVDVPAFSRANGTFTFNERGHPLQQPDGRLPRRPGATGCNDAHRWHDRRQRDRDRDTTGAEARTRHRCRAAHCSIVPRAAPGTPRA